MSAMTRYWVRHDGSMSNLFYSAPGESGYVEVVLAKDIEAHEAALRARVKHLERQVERLLDQIVEEM